MARAAVVLEHLKELRLAERVGWIALERQLDLPQLGCLRVFARLLFARGLLGHRLLRLPVVRAHQRRILRFAAAARREQQQSARHKQLTQPAQPSGHRAAA